MAAISPEFIRMMARYNGWQNDHLLAAADTITDTERRKDRGAFFASIHQTFSHLLWGDKIWMSRFSDLPAPQANIAQSKYLFSDWDGFKKERKEFDQAIMSWADTVNADWIDGNLTWWSGAANKEVTKSKSLLVVHFFNHQTHHRGQIHAMLTAADAKLSDTDLFFLPD